VRKRDGAGRAVKKGDTKETAISASFTDVLLDRQNRKESHSPDEFTQIVRPEMPCQPQSCGIYGHQCDPVRRSSAPCPGPLIQAMLMSYQAFDSLD
jgi:hypothetical protein